MKRILRRATLTQVRHVSPVPAALAGGLVAEVYSQVERDFGMLAPPISLHSPSPTVLAASWLMLRETLLVRARTHRAVRETVAAAVSQVNACPYCVDVHTTLRYGLVPRTAVADGDLAVATDPELQAVASWAQASTAPGTGQWPAVIPRECRTDLLAVAATFHYLNRMVNVFLVSSPLPPRLANRVRERLKRRLGVLLAGRTGREAQPGAALHLLPQASLPADLGWAAAASNLSAALARAAAAIDTAGQRAVPETVRYRVLADLARWDGQPPGISRAWVEEAVAGLPEPDRAVGRLALLVAFASYQVDDSVVAGFRQQCPDDAALIEVASWASLAAARQIVSWAAVGSGGGGEQPG